MGAGKYPVGSDADPGSGGALSIWHFVPIKPGKRKFLNFLRKIFPEKILLRDYRSVGGNDKTLPASFRPDLTYIGET